MTHFTTATTPRAVTLTLQSCTFSWHLPWTSSYWTRIFSTHSTLWVSEWDETDHGQDSHISQSRVKWKHDRGSVLNLSTGNRSQQCLHTCVTLQANQIKCFNTKLFIIMLKTSKLFTTATNFFATIQATNITPGWSTRRQTHRRKAHYRTQRKEVSPGVKKEYFCMIENWSISRLTFCFPQINSN